LENAATVDLSERRRRISAQRDYEDQMRARAAQQAAEMLAAAETIAGHSYLKRKGFPDELGRVLNGTLLVPMRLGKNLVNLQRIDPDGSKKFLPGGLAKRAHLIMGQRRGVGAYWLCEGFATGLTLKVALGRLARRYDAVVVCFSAGNLSVVCGMFDGPRFVAADNDRSKAGELAAIKSNVPWVMPETVGDDFNDLHQREGIYAVCDLIRSL
jgi:putative DNA primase/helicase